MLRSELINILQKQNEKYGDRNVYGIKSVEGGVTGRNIKAVELDADDNTVINITD